MNNASVCRANGWGPGTKLVGDEGYGPEVIMITAVGKEKILAGSISRNGSPVDFGEGVWTLEFRTWREYTAKEHPELELKV